MVSKNEVMQIIYDKISFQIANSYTVGKEKSLHVVVELYEESVVEAAQAIVDLFAREKPLT